MEICQKLRFSYNPKNDGKSEAFNLTYYVPFFSDYKLKKVIDKAIKQTELTADNKDISITVENTECDLTRNIIAKAAEIDKLSYDIISIDFSCSVNCNEFNRTWICCGQFAPFMYIYSFLLLEGNYDRYKDKFGHEGMIEKSSQIYNIANVFYKIFSGYADDNPKYIDNKETIGDLYGINIPDVYEDLDYWLDIEKNIFKFQTDARFLDFENNKSYLILINNNNFGIIHFCYIYRYNNYIIICDTWSDYHDRMPITRIMEYDEFIKYIIKINNLYKLYNDNDNDNGSKDITDELLLYNFIIDSLFLVPYGEEHISEGKQSFSIENLSYIVVVEPSKIVEVLDTLSEENGRGAFDLYSELGGGKKRRKKTIKNKKKYNKKRKSKKYKK